MAPRRATLALPSSLSCSPSAPSHYNLRPRRRHRRFKATEPGFAAVRAMTTIMGQFNQILQDRNTMFEGMLQHKRAEKEKMRAEVARVLAAAAEAGADMAEKATWAGISNIIADDRETALFMEAPLPGRLHLISINSRGDYYQVREQRRRRRQQQKEEDEKWYGIFFNIMMMEDDAGAFMYGMFRYAIHLDEHCNIGMGTNEASG